MSKTCERVMVRRSEVTVRRQTSRPPSPVTVKRLERVEEVEEEVVVFSR